MIARLEKTSKEYVLGDQRIVALDKTDLEVKLGELLLIIGPSGSGKTTLLSLLGCVIYPTTGKLWLNDKLVNDLNEKERAKLRLNVIGFVFQNFNLLAPLTAEQNVMMPLQLKGENNKEAQIKVDNALQLVGMQDRRKNLPKELSGGQQQLVGVARALVSKPSLILADEPTGNLNSKQGEEIMNLFKQLNEEDGVTIIQVTHSEKNAAYGSSIIHLLDGRIEK